MLNLCWFQHRLQPYLRRLQKNVQFLLVTLFSEPVYVAALTFQHFKPSVQLIKLSNAHFSESLRIMVLSMVTIAVDIYKEHHT